MREYVSLVDKDKMSQLAEKPYKGQLCYLELKVPRHHDRAHSEMYLMLPVMIVHLCWVEDKSRRSEESFCRAEIQFLGTDHLEWGRMRNS